MTNTITGNEDQPDDDKLPKINLAELREKKRQILQRNYAQNNAQNGDSGKPIDLSEIRQQKRQIQKQNELEEEIVLPFTVPRPEDEEEQTLPFSVSGPEGDSSLQDTIAGTYSKSEYFSKLEKAGKDRFAYFLTEDKETKAVVRDDALTLLRGKYEFNIFDFKGMADSAVQSEEAFKNLVQKLQEVIVEQEKEPLLAKYLPSLIEWGVLEDKETGENFAGWYVMQKNEE
jgi:hypothetical protein